MLDALKTLWISQNQTNLAQLGEPNIESLRSWGFYQDFFNDISDFPEREEYWKYNKFKGLKKRKFRFLAPGKTNRVVKVSKEHYRVEIWDPSQGSKWEIEDNPYISPISNILSRGENLRDWSEFLGRPRPSNFITTMNRGFLYSGVAVTVPKNTSLRLEVDNHWSGEAEDFIAQHLFARVGPGAQLKLSENNFGDNCKGLVFYDRVFHLEENASVHAFGGEQGSPSSHIFQNTYVTIEKDALWNGFDLTLPSLWSRHNTTATMVGENAQSNFYGLYINDQDYFCDHHTAVEHMRPSTFSNQIYKGVLSGTSEAVFNGKVLISEGSSLSNSQQLNKNLLLSEKAEIHTKPELKIYNDDVKAAHGATVGQLDDEQLFYLQSRGFTKEKAWDYLCQSFTGDVFQDFAGDTDWGDTLVSNLETVNASLRKMGPQKHV